MSGVKGRSGFRPKTMEEAAHKQEIMRAANAKRWGHDTPATPHDPSFTGPFQSMEDYLKRLGPPLSWSDAEKIEKVRGEINKNEDAELSRQVARGELFTVEQVAERDASWNTTAAEQAEIVQRLIDGMPGITLPQREWYLERYREWRRVLGERLAKARG